MWSWFSVETIVQVIFCIYYLTPQTSYCLLNFPNVCFLTVRHRSPLDSHSVAAGLQLFYLSDSFWIPVWKHNLFCTLYRLASSIPLLSRLHSSNIHLCVTIPSAPSCVPTRTRNPRHVLRTDSRRCHFTLALQRNTLTRPGFGPDADNGFLVLVVKIFIWLNWGRLFLRNRALQFCVPLEQSQDREAARPRSLCWTRCPHVPL